MKNRHYRRARRQIQKVRRVLDDTIRRAEDLQLRLHEEPLRGAASDEDKAEVVSEVELLRRGIVRLMDAQARVRMALGLEPLLGDEDPEQILRDLRAHGADPLTLAQCSDEDLAVNPAFLGRLKEAALEASEAKPTFAPGEQPQSPYSEDVTPEEADRRRRELREKAARAAQAGQRKIDVDEHRRNQGG